MDPHGEVLRAALHEAAERTVPGEGLTAIRTRARVPRWRRALTAIRTWDRAITAGFASIALTPTRKTAAPDAPEAAATADNLEGPPAMAHTLQSETTPRGRQILAAITLAHLLETDPIADLPDAPPIEWRIDALGSLHGHVHDPWNETRARAAMVAVAEFLGVPVAGSRRHNERSEWVLLTATGTYRGVPVNVWTHVAIRVTNPYGSRS